MDSNLNEDTILDYIQKYIKILNKNFDIKTPVNKKIPFNDIFDMITDLNNLFNTYYEINQINCSKVVKKHYIPLLNLLIKIDKNGENTTKYSQYIKNAYKMSARTNLEDYFIYREWEEKDKFYAPRYNILSGYVHYLEEITTNPHFRLLIANLPSGYGKTFSEKISEAWNFGIDDTGTVIYLCSNDDVVKGGSRTVMDEIKSETFGEVFPDKKWSEDDRNYFLKETEGNWKLKNCKLSASYYARTVNSNVIGTRASQRIHIDDLYADYKEAMNQETNTLYLNRFLTVWRARFVQHKIPKVVVTGTLWASGDFIALLIAMAKKQNKFHRSTKYKYTYLNEDESIAIIQVPALDYETGLSTCPELKTTEELEELKSNMDEYLFETNFQQQPTDPESLFFSYNKLKTYDKLPETDFYGTYSVIDSTRKSGRDFFAMPIFSKVSEENGYEYYLKDCVFTRTATKDMYEAICEKIVEHHIIELVIESNVTSELKQNIDTILKNNGVNFCIIREKYNCETKSVRIETEKGNIVRKLVFPMKGKYGINTDMGKFMNNLTLYNGNGRNENDDAPDSLGMFTHEIIDGGALPTKAIIMKRPF